MNRPWPAFRDAPYMGVIHVVTEAARLGFVNGHPDWSNLGQGQPEVGDIDGAPARLNAMELERGDHAYGPIGGTDALRQAVADHYNRLFRRGHREKYSASNVAIASGGRLALSRLLAALNDVRIGYQTPDYCGLTAALQRGRVAVSRRAGAQGELFPGGTST
jgi:aspartate/methionine/tyrosine aminotransferase